jgi:hypothetical protein
VIQIGGKLPTLRAPALRQGTVVYFDSRELKGRWWALCILPNHEPRNSSVPFQEAAVLVKQGLQIILVEPEAAKGLPGQTHWNGPAELPLLVDLLGLLRRRVGIAGLPQARCRTFLIDPSSAVQFQLVHDLNSKGLNALIEIFKACRETIPVPSGDRANLEKHGSLV